MTLEFQHVWGDLIVIDLFFGGWGASCLLLAAVSLFSRRALSLVAPWTATNLDNTLLQTRTLALALSASGVAFVGVGVLMLLLDLLHPQAVWYLLGNPRSWMFWGTVFIAGIMVFGTLFAWAQAVSLLAALGNRVWIFKRLTAAARALQRHERSLGIVVGTLGLAYTMYTGLLLTMAPAIPFWRTPALPMLFLVSGLSAAAAYALLLKMVLGWFQAKSNALPGSDLGLLLLELLIVLSYFNFGRMGSAGVKTSVEFLYHQAGFCWGVLLLGLVVPMGIELMRIWKPSLRRHRTLSVISACLVVVGVYLLRYYVVFAGVFEFPW